LTENQLGPRPSRYILGDFGHEFAVSHVKALYPTCYYRKLDLSDKYEYFNPVPRVFAYKKDTGVIGADVSWLGDPIGFFSSHGGTSWNSSNYQGLTLSQLNAAATDAIGIMNPFRRQGGIFADLIELLRGDVPRIVLDLTKHMRTIQRMKASGIKSAGQAIGSDYLNAVFGWAPIIRDIIAAIEVLTTIDKLIFPSDSTRRTFKRTVSSGAASLVTSANLGLFGILNPGFGINAQSADMTRTSGIVNNGFWSASDTAGVSYTESVYTTARFATGATPNAANNGHLDRAIDLLGLEITPDMVWELLPWSWLIDWFTNVGTIIQSMSTLGLSNTILNYAYATYRRETLHTVKVDPRTVAGTGSILFTGGDSFAVITDQKVRIAASPFGFGIAGDSLTVSQLAILTALGLARSR